MKKIVASSVVVMLFAAAFAVEQAPKPENLGVSAEQADKNSCNQCTSVPAETVKSPEKVPFCVNEKELIIGDAIFKFVPVVGYKTYEDVKNQKDGVEIGLMVKRTYTNTTKEFCVTDVKTFIKDEFANKGWWIVDEDGLNKVSAFQFNSFYVGSKYMGLDILVDQVEAFGLLSADDKAAHLTNLSTCSTAMLENCDLKGYWNLMFALDTIKYLKDKNEFSNAEMVAFFMVVYAIRKELDAIKEILDAYEISESETCEVVDVTEESNQVCIDCVSQ